MAKGIADGKLTIRPLTAGHVDDLKIVTAGTWGASCWCLFPRYTAAQKRERGLDKGGNAARRAEVMRLARRRNAPGLIAYRGIEPIGWIAVGPRTDRLLHADFRARRAHDDERCVPRCPAVAQHLGDDLGPDSARIAERDGEARQSHYCVPFGGASARTTARSVPTRAGCAISKGA